MTDAALPPVSIKSPGRWLFAVAVFVSASLVFVVQPMLAKMILPRLGGSAMVWNTSLVFFQAALLAGYFYADLLQRVASLRRQFVIHLVVLAVAALALPLRISGLLGDPWVSAPAPWLVASMALSIGAPFAALSATAPLIQAWYGRIHGADANPYALYAASNLGSLLALLAYPLFIEPFARLGTQSVGWSLGYGAFALITASLALLAWRARDHHAAAVEPAAPITWRQRLVWLALSAAPSSLLLGVTGHISADIASAPFLWVAPLALYLITFIVAFETRAAGFEHWAPFLRVVLVPEALLLFAIPGAHPLLQLPVHLLAFFFTAQVCAFALARRRPPPARLTEFYLWLSVGGVLGGAFTALVAPLIFNGVWEYPIVLILACLAGPAIARRRMAPFEWGCLGISLVCAAVLLSGIELSGEIRAALMLTPAVSALLLRNQTLALVTVLAALALASYAPKMLKGDATAHRSFFGVLQIKTAQSTDLGPVRIMVHGSTVHGTQILDPARRCQATSYYTPNTPIGQVFATEQSQAPGLNIGTVGLGTGTVAAFVRPGDHLTFFEIDPLVVKLASDTTKFTYVNGCARGPVTMVLGDARLQLDKAPDASFDFLLVDAFSSDAVPTHLLTVEAMRTYLRVVKPGGVVALHLSNRNLALIEPAAAAVRAAGGTPLDQLFHSATRDTYAESSSHVLIAARDPAALAPYLATGKWDVPDPGRPWTDDYTNIVGAILARMKANSE